MRFNLRGLFVAVTLSGILTGWYVDYSSQEKEIADLDFRLNMAAAAWVSRMDSMDKLTTEQISMSTAWQLVMSALDPHIPVAIAAQKRLEQISGSSSNT